MKRTRKAAQVIQEVQWLSCVSSYAMQWQQILTAAQQKKLPQVLLFTGASSESLFSFSYATAASQFCLKGSACQVCEGCRTVAQQLQPDLLVMQTEEASLKVEEAGDIEEFLQTQPAAIQPGVTGRRVCILRDVEKLTNSAVNSLLKTLEEPPSHALVILTCTRRRMLLPTLLSRCVTYRLRGGPPSQDMYQQHAITSEEEQKILQLLGSSSLSNDALFAAEHLAKNLKVDVKSFLFKAEIVLNRYYRDLAEGENACQRSGDLLSKRKKMRQLKDLVVRKKIALNAQLSLESFISENK